MPLVKRMTSTLVSVVIAWAGTAVAFYFLVLGANWCLDGGCKRALDSAMGEDVWRCTLTDGQIVGVLGEPSGDWITDMDGIRHPQDRVDSCENLSE